MDICSCVRLVPSSCFALLSLLIFSLHSLSFLEERKIYSSK